MKKMIIIGSNGVLGQYIVEKAIEKIGIDNIVLSDYKQNRLKSQAENIGYKYGKIPETKVMDVSSRKSLNEGLENIDSVVVALQQQEPIIQQICIKKGINSIDLSVNSDFIEKAMRLKANSDSIQILTGGLFPGLTGIIAKDLCSDGARGIIDVGLLQSKNGTNGKTGVSDMLKIFNSTVEYIEESHAEKLPGFSKKVKFDFGPEKGEQVLRLSNFVERELLIDSGVKTNFYTAFDKESTNRAISILRKTGILKLMKYDRFSNFISRLISSGYNSNRDESIGLSFKSVPKSSYLILKSDYEATASCAIAFLDLTKNKESRGIKFPFQLFTFRDIKEHIKEVIINYDIPGV